MLSKNKIKLINSLSLKKNRDEEKLFVAEGVKIVSELIDSNFELVSIFAHEDFFNANNIDNVIEKITVNESELKSISNLKTPNQVLAIVKLPAQELKMNDITNQFSIAFEDIQDPGNLGTIIRTADWFGIKNIICSNNSVNVYNPKVVQATMGAISRVNVFYTELDTFLKQSLEFGLKIYGTLLNGESIYNHNLTDKGIVLFGNESKGISSELQKYISNKISIPSALFNKTESLNVSMAMGIVCSEFFRKNL
ncbi:MAG TPA: RNA methyltransferase [Bacteroidales bacterium]|nr:MAG: hypothetical protein A2W98_14815 [Bacteroidetes bacterium GWF2_33_38]OFY91341.1 MAG: hypothetical protein A2236_13715 [Bacteroidetes bacterium RIFOXYA2_FULL_33_7]HBF88597.1 RNA methyltransferase [Bacteroidales bacterium]